MEEQDLRKDERGDANERKDKAEKPHSDRSFESRARKYAFG